MRVLVGCECSQVVTAAFRALGHDAFSCDTQDSYGDLPEYHFKGDLKEVYAFVNPDLFIAHPPCTFLTHGQTSRICFSGGSIKDWLRYEKGIYARSFFSWCLSRPAKMLCIENPIPSPVFGLPRYSQLVEPWFFGHPYSKSTCLWLRGLPLLQCTDIVRPLGVWTDLHHSQRKRSETFSGLAAAMASQWGSGELVGYQYKAFSQDETNTS